MMRRILAYGVVATLGLFLLGISGCAITPPTRFYVLPPLPRADTAPGAAPVQRALTIGVGPVLLPAYLDRPQIVSRASPAKLDLADFDQWAAPLQQAIARALADNLAVLIPSDRVLLAPWPRTTAVDYQVLVELLRFDGPLGGTVVLAARWSLADANGNELLLRLSQMTAPTEGGDYEALVMALSRTLDALSRDIAAALLHVAPPASTRQ
jgi:uncharacterized protein